MVTRLYKGRRSWNKEWVKGNLVINNQGDMAIIPPDVVVPDGHHLRIDDDRPVFFDQETISEETGNIDANGNSIFTNDIVSCQCVSKIITGTVTFLKSSYGVKTHIKGYAKDSFCFTPFDELDGFIIKVIGNCFEEEDV